MLKHFIPESNLPFICKLIEQAVCDQLNTSLDTNKLLDELQSDFCVTHSAETTLLKIKSNILEKYG